MCVPKHKHCRTTRAQRECKACRRAIATAFPNCFKAGGRIGESDECIAGLRARKWAASHGGQKRAHQIERRSHSCSGPTAVAGTQFASELRLKEKRSEQASLDRSETGRGNHFEIMKWNWRFNFRT